MTAPAPALLARSPLFRRLAASDIERVAAEVRVADFRKDTRIITQHQQAAAIYIILSGIAKVVMRDGHGRKTALAYLTSGDAFGEESAFVGTASAADVTAVTDLTLVIIPREKLDLLTRRMPDLAWNFITSLCTRLHQADVTITDLAFKNLEGRVAAKIIQLGDKFGEPMNDVGRLVIPVTHSELAELAGTNRETVTKILATLKKMGVLITEQRSIVVVDVPRLREIAKN